MESLPLKDPPADSADDSTATPSGSQPPTQATISQKHPQARHHPGALSHATSTVVLMFIMVAALLAALALLAYSQS